MAVTSTTACDRQSESSFVIIYRRILTVCDLRVDEVEDLFF